MPPLKHKPVPTESRKLEALWTWPCGPGVGSRQTSAPGGAQSPASSITSCMTFTPWPTLGPPSDVWSPQHPLNLPLHSFAERAHFTQLLYSKCLKLFSHFQRLPPPTSSVGLGFQRSMKSPGYLLAFVRDTIEAHANTLFLPGSSLAKLLASVCMGNVCLSAPP